MYVVSYVKSFCIVNDFCNLKFKNNGYIFCAAQFLFCSQTGRHNISIYSNVHTFSSGYFFFTKTTFECTLVFPSVCPSVKIGIRQLNLLLHSHFIEIQFCQTKLIIFTLDGNCVSFTITIQSKSDKFSCLVN